MLRRIDANPKLLSDLSEKTRVNAGIQKQTANDQGDIKFYQSGDGKRTFVRVCETIPPEKGVGPATYVFTVYEVLPALGAEANPAPAILTVK